MLDNLKDHIKDHREDFETYPFDTEQGWAELSKKLVPAKEWQMWNIVSAAACILFVMLGTIAQLPVSNNGGELSEVESFYENEINYKISLVKSHLEDPTVLQDLAIMDQAFTELKADLKENVDNEEVVAAMMENYQLKLRILEEILGELVKENSESSL